jgi:hypothetical protein
LKLVRVCIERIKENHTKWTRKIEECERINEEEKQVGYYKGKEEEIWPE